MTGQHAIDLALDLARMPALARTSVVPPIPPNVVDLMRIAAANPQACQDAAAKTGEKIPVLIEAARFYLQQALFRPNADCYRILGVEPATPRATTRNHMRWLLQWLHPDHNSSWDAVYAERVLKAWREVSTSDSAQPDKPWRPHPIPSRRKSGEIATIRLPWIEHPLQRSRQNISNSYRMFVAITTGFVIVFLAICSALYYFGMTQTAAMVQ